jgi:hypothetical protein
MNERTKTGLEIVQAAVLIGVLGNVLLRQPPWGLSAFLFVTAFVAAMLMLMRRRRPELLTTNTLALSGAMVFFAAMFVIRDAEQLLVFDTMAILVIMGVLLLANLDIKANVAGAFHYAVGFMWSGFSSAFGPLLILGSDIDWKAMPKKGGFSRSIFAVLRGLAIALPLLLIFGGLFMAADAAFEGLVNRALNFNIDVAVSHIAFSSVLAWLTAGYFRGALISMIPSPPVEEKQAEAKKEEDGKAGASFVAKVADEPVDMSSSLPDNATILEHINRSDPPNILSTEIKNKRDWQNFDNSVMPTVFTLGAIETVVVIGLLDLLFLAFVIVQVPYLFGGMDLVQNTPDFKLADYARRGFGELVVVASLVLPLLLVSHWLLRRDNALPEKLFKIFAGVQIALLFVIMASAVQRLVLLTGDLGYGMTTVRFYPMVLMAWLAVVFGWFALTVFRGARQHFAWGALWAGIVILGGTNLLNPDGFIVRTNYDLMQRGREYDSVYNVNLSDDAVPALLEALPSMNPYDGCITRMRLRDRLIQTLDEQDLRSWNLSRQTGRNLIAETDAVVNETAVYNGCSHLAGDGK